MEKDYPKVARSAFRLFCQAYFYGLKEQRFGQAFMNHFGYMENQGFFDTLWNTTSVSEASNIIEQHLIDWEK